MRYELNFGSPHFTVDEIDIVRVSRGKNYRHSYRNGRLKHGFVYTVSGEMCDTFFDAEERSVSVRAGELMFIPKGSRYVGTYVGEGTEICIVQFNVSAGALPDYLSRPTKIELPDAEREIAPFFALAQNGQKEHPFYILSCLYHLLFKIDESRSVLPPKYRKLHAVLADMQSVPEAVRSAGEYAALCGMSEVNFRRLFRQYTGLSPIEYRNDIRLSRAHTKIMSGEYNVSEAALDVGFSNLSFFIRLYKKKFGHTPTRE